MRRKADKRYVSRAEAVNDFKKLTFDTLYAVDGEGTIKKYAITTIKALSI